MIAMEPTKMISLAKGMLPRPMAIVKATNRRLPPRIIQLGSVSVSACSKTSSRTRALLRPSLRSRAARRRTETMPRITPSTETMGMNSAIR